MIGPLASVRLTTCIPVCSITHSPAGPKLPRACVALVRDGLFHQRVGGGKPERADGGLAVASPEACSLARLSRAECCCARLVAMLPWPVLARSKPVPCCCAAFDGWVLVAQRRPDRWAACGGSGRWFRRYVEIHTQGISMCTAWRLCSVVYMFPTRRMSSTNYTFPLSLGEKDGVVRPVVLSCEDRSSPKSQTRVFIRNAFQLWEGLHIIVVYVTNTVDCSCRTRENLSGLCASFASGQFSTRPMWYV